VCFPGQRAVDTTLDAARSFLELVAAADFVRGTKWIRAQLIRHASVIGL
jgi:hypothetical protein